MQSGVVLSFTEPQEYQERIRPAEVQMIPTAGGEFRATLSQTNLHHLTLQHGWQSLPTMVRCELSKSRTSLMFQTGRAPAVMKADGVDLSPDVIGLGAPGEEHFIQTSSDCSWATLTLTPATYATARATLVGDDFDKVLRTSFVRPPPAAMVRLRSLHHSVMNLVSSGPNHAAHPEAARGAEQALLGAVVDCLANDSHITVPKLGDRNGTAADAEVV